ncbi:MAG: SUMF1/EgtB/PvdO family nonheme iron enzyme [Elainella sp.]
MLQFVSPVDSTPLPLVFFTYFDALVLQEITCAARNQRWDRQTNCLLRGGSWINNPQNCRSANRNRNAPDNLNSNVGFRVVVVLA